MEEKERWNGLWAGQRGDGGEKQADVNSQLAT